MNTRIFRVQIKPGLRQEFEQKFATVSADAVKTREGFSDVFIGRPCKWTPDEYVMISYWDSEASLAEFAGPGRERAGMKKFVESCSVHHYEAW